MADEYYVSITECNNHFGMDFSFYEEWEALDDTAKSRYIVSAMRYIEDGFGDWVGNAVSSNQEYAFPRDFSNVWSSQDLSDIYYRAHLKIPVEVKKAMYLIIKDLYNANDKKDMMNMQSLNASGISDSVVSISFTDTVFDNVMRNQETITGLLYRFTLFGWSNAKH